MKKKNDFIIIGLALFAMFFGAGNLIFPPTLGIQSGNNWQAALIGFLLTGVGLPLLAIFGLTKAKGKIDEFCGESKIINLVYNSALILSIGPLLAMPRTGAVTFELGVKPFLSESISTGMVTTLQWIVSIIFFGLTLFFAIKPSKMLDRIGKFLTPAILIILALIIGIGIFKPFGIIQNIDMKNPFTTGFLEGYNTMDALAGVIFGAVVIELIRARGYKSEKENSIVLLKSSIIAALGLGLIYFGLTFLGAKAGGFIDPTTGEVIKNVARTDLLGLLAKITLGDYGKLALGLCVAFACLTTSIGLCATVGNFFSKHLPVKYEIIVTITAIGSMLIANLGVDKIVLVSVPILILIFPITITLIVLNIFRGFIKNRMAFIGGIIGSGIISLFDSLDIMVALKIFTNESIVEFIGKITKFKVSLPLGEMGFSWILPALLLAIAFNFLPQKKLHN